MEATKRSDDDIINGGDTTQGGCNTGVLLNCCEVDDTSTVRHISSPSPCLHLVSYPCQDALVVASLDRILYKNIKSDHLEVISLPRKDSSNVEGNIQDDFLNVNSDGESEEESTNCVFITCMHSIGNSERLLIGVADSAKRVFVYELPSRVLLLTLTLPKAITKILIAPDNKHVVIGDKSGDVYRFPLNSGPILKVSSCSHATMERSPYLMLGNFSIVTDIAIDSEQKFIYSAQRDQKIKCSFFSAPDVIKYFFLGHSEYVASICLVEPRSILLSCGGDPYILLVDFSNESKIAYKKIYFDNLFPQDHQGCCVWNCVKLVMVDDSHFAVLFEKREIIPIIQIDWSTRDATLSRIIRSPAWVIDIASNASSSSLAYLVDGSASVFNLSLSEGESCEGKKIDLDCCDVIHSYPKEVHCNILSLFTMNKYRRGYNQEKRNRLN